MAKRLKVTVTVGDLRAPERPAPARRQLSGRTTTSADA
jgi:hypothetical protein